MKKLIWILCLLLGAASLYSIEADNFGVSLGVLGAGVEAFSDTAEAHFFGRVLTFMYQGDNNLGLSASPFVFNVSFGDEVQFSCSFINVSLFYNILGAYRNNLILGPFAAINAVNNGDPHFYEFRSGIICTLRNVPFLEYYQGSVFNLELISLETGYKYSERTGHAFYLQCGVDIISALMLLGSGEEDAYKEYHRDHPVY